MLQRRRTRRPGIRSAPGISVRRRTHCTRSSRSPDPPGARPCRAHGLRTAGVKSIDRCWRSDRRPTSGSIHIYLSLDAARPGQDTITMNGGGSACTYATVTVRMLPFCSPMKTGDPLARRRRAVSTPPLSPGTVCVGPPGLVSILLQ